ncbi:MAG: hypothetical protein R8K48_02170 [Gallionella sp.]
MAFERLSLLGEGHEAVLIADAHRRSIYPGYVNDEVVGARLSGYNQLDKVEILYSDGAAIEEACFLDGRDMA